MTVSEALRSATQRLSLAEVPDAAGDARALMAYALGVARSRVTLMAPDPMPQEAGMRLDAALDARVRRVPVSRILGYRDFCGHRFRINGDVLDPRPETEVLVETALGQPFRHVIDLGTGSGAIVLSLLSACPDATGTGTDLSAAALDVARANAADLGLSDRVRFLQADWWSGVQTRFDLVVSNPPYIDEGELSGLDPEVVAHDPPMALSPGGDGLDAYRYLLAGLREHLTPSGRALFELGAGQGAALRALARQHGFSEISILPDLDGRDRVMVLTPEQAKRAG